MKQEETRREDWKKSASKSYPVDNKVYGKALTIQITIQWVDFFTFQLTAVLGPTKELTVINVHTYNLAQFFSKNVNAHKLKIFTLDIWMLWRVAFIEF